MINFFQFERDLRDYLNGNTNSRSPRNIDYTAKYIANLYDSYVRTGTDLNYRNSVNTVNRQVLQSTLETMFTTAFRTNNNRFFEIMLYQGLVGYWAGGTLKYLVPPPTSIQIVSNIVTFPGNKQFFNIVNTTDNTIFAKKLVALFKNHMLGLRGITTSLVPQPTGPPIPITFPWIGYG